MTGVVIVLVVLVMVLAGGDHGPMVRGRVPARPD